MTRKVQSSMPAKQFPHKRLTDEFNIITAMLHIYCNDHHSRIKDKKILCPECRELQHYAKKRLLHCPFQHNKPTCGNCKIHCYKKRMRSKIQTVMRYAGPRMMYKHPIMALKHLIDSRRKSLDLANNDYESP